METGRSLTVVTRGSLPATLSNEDLHSALSLMNEQMGKSLPERSTILTDKEIDRLQEFVLSQMVPAGDEPVAVVLNMMCELYQVELPTTNVVKLYMSKLGRFPRDILEAATNRVVETHRYKIMPTIAHFTGFADPLMNERTSMLLAIQTYRKLEDYRRKYYKDAPAQTFVDRATGQSKMASLRKLLEKVTKQQKDKL